MFDQLVEGRVIINKERKKIFFPSSEYCGRLLQINYMMCFQLITFCKFRSQYRNSFLDPGNIWSQIPEVFLSRTNNIYLHEDIFAWKYPWEEWSLKQDRQNTSRKLNPKLSLSRCWLVKSAETPSQTSPCWINHCRSSRAAFQIAKLKPHCFEVLNPSCFKKF